VLASEASFEGKMEELCRELGDRGKAALGTRAIEDACCSLDTAALALQLQQSVDRMALLEKWLECTNEALVQIGRKERQGLLVRTETLLDQLESDHLAWMGAVWEPEHALLVAQAAERVLSMQGMGAADVTGAVTGLLTALEEVASAHEPRAEVLLAALQSGGVTVDRVVEILEHGLEALDAVSMSTPRKKRKSVEALCAQMEGVLEGADERLVAHWATVELSELTLLSECLCAVEALAAGTSEGGTECADAVRALLEALEQCCDVVVGE
jgi:hypothetical protein